jgi:hypothetical protein
MRRVVPPGMYMFTVLLQSHRLGCVCSSILCINTRLCTGAVLAKHLAFAMWVLQHGTSSTVQTERQRDNNYTFTDCTVTALLAVRHWASPSKLLSHIDIFFIIYFQACPVTYAILHALFYLPRCLSSCDFDCLVLSYTLYRFCFVRLLVSG